MERPPGRTGWSRFGKEKEADREDEPEREDEVEEARRWPSELADGVAGKLAIVS